MSIYVLAFGIFGELWIWKCFGDGIPKGSGEGTMGVVFSPSLDLIWEIQACIHVSMDVTQPLMVVLVIVIFSKKFMLSI